MSSYNKNKHNKHNKIYNTHNLKQNFNQYSNNNNYNKDFDNFDINSFKQLNPDLENKTDLDIYTSYLLDKNRLTKKDNNEKYINILITITTLSDNIKSCINSIINQNYTNFKIICFYEYEKCLDYLNEYEDKIEYKNTNIISINDFIEQIDEWIININEDEIFNTNEALNIINSNLYYDNILLKIGKHKCFNKNSFNIKNLSFNLIDNLHNKIGIIITTNGNWGINVKQCLECYIRNVKNCFIVLYINESNDPLTLSLEFLFPQITVIYIKDQIKNGGLTATWNDGIELCMKEKCNIFILSNDDILFDNSINYIIDEALNVRQDELKYFGPITNNPGPAEINKLQYGIKPLDNKPYSLKFNNKYININGFFMVFPKHVLIKNKFNHNKYFDPSLPFGGNETEWFNRFIEKGGEPIIVPKTFIYHYKFARWRKNNIYNNVCLYTINTGGYEGYNIYIKPELPIDYLYFTDNFHLVYKCVELGIIPFYISSNDPKLLQRIVKTSPHLYLPDIYDTSIYIDGNIQPTFNNNILNKLVNQSYDIICFKHPDVDTIQEEAQRVIGWNLEKYENIIKILQLQKKDGFKDDVGLTETNILVRKHKKIKTFNNEWTNCIKICRRDQLSFDYLLDKHKINYLKLSNEKKLLINNRIKHINPYNRKIK